ncbi:MAG: AsmA-like C-terminal region-containing protein [Pseudomonadota bacterium]
MQAKQRSDGTGGKAPGIGRICLRVCGRACVRVGHVLLTLLLIGVLGAGALYARLSMGPMRLPGVAEPLSAYLSGDGSQFRLAIGDVVLSLGEDGAESGLQFRNVRVFTPEDALLMSAPRVGARFDAGDLMRGEVQPTRVVLLRPKAEVVRQEDGRIRIGLGTDAGLTLGDANKAGDPEQFDALARVMDGLAGDSEMVPELARLRDITIAGIAVRYRDMLTGGAWRTKDAAIRIRRQDWGVEATLRAALSGEAGKQVPLVMIARREAGQGTTEIDLSFEDIAPEALSAQLPTIDWGGLLDGRLSGFLSTELGRDGRLGDISGVLRAEDGALKLGGGEQRRFDRIEAAFTYEPEIARLNIETVELRAPDAEARLSGILDLRKGTDGAVAGFDTQLDVHRARLQVPKIFAEELRFDDGQVTARIALDPLQIELRDTHLSQGDLVFNLDGRVRPSEDGVVTDIRAAAINLTVAQLMAHWPLAAAQNARDWIDQNISEGLVNDLIAHIRMDKGEPQLSLDFTYSGLTSRYVGDMSPIRGANGRGHLTFHDFFLFLEQGVVTPRPGQRVVLGPSRLVFRDLWGKVTPAEVTITGEGGLGAILALIDEEPLGLVGKIGLKPGQIDGAAQVRADLTFPLLADLQLEQVTAAVGADLANVAMPFDLAGTPVRVAGRQVRLDGTTAAMRIAGDIEVDGAPITLDWEERYGEGSDHRSVRAKGQITPALLASFGAEVDGFDGGAIAADLALDQRGTPELALDLTADLKAAALRVADVDWAKPAGTPGRLSISGRLGEEVRIDRLSMDAAGLSLSGSMAFDAEGALRQARLERVRLDDRIDLGVTVSPSRAGLNVRLEGALLDLDALGEEATGAETEPAPLSAEFNIAEVRVTETLTVTNADGRYRQDADGAEAEVTGRVGPEARIAATYTKTDLGKTVLQVTSQDTGALLKHLDVYDGAVEGDMTLLADVEPSAGVDLSGLLKVRNLRLGDGDGLTKVLRSGRFGNEQVEEVSRGLTFRSIRIPFTMAEGRIILGDSFAKSPSLAVTAAGEVNQRDGQIDVVGTISPAYGVTGALDDVPVLGRIFSGSEGEGIFAMTYSMRGALEDPEISVNPLSLLTPGFLRQIFSGKRAAPDADFIERIQRDK